MIFRLKATENVTYSARSVHVSIWVDTDLGGRGFFAFFAGEN